MLKYFVVGIITAAAGLAIGASLPKVREELKKQREEREKKAAAEKQAAEKRAAEAEALRHEHERQELAEVAKMDPKAQVLYFERRREQEERRRRVLLEEERQRKAARGFGTILRAIAAWRGLSWLAVFAHQVADGFLDIFRWLSGSKEA